MRFLYACLCLLLVAWAAFSAEPPKQAPTSTFCLCRQAGGPPCDCGVPGACGAVLCPPKGSQPPKQAPAPAQAPGRTPGASGDPYGYANYSDFLEQIKVGIRGVLVIGIADQWVATYKMHCRVESGFGGLANGEYDCWMQDGKAVMELRKAVAAKPRPFRQAPTTPAIRAPTAGVLSTPLAATTATAPTPAFAPLAARRGNISCTSYG